MATTSYRPPRSGVADWNDPSVWSSGVVPNDPTIDVIVPPVTLNGFPFVTTITETGSITIGSVAIQQQNLSIKGTLSVRGLADILPRSSSLSGPSSGIVSLDGGALVAASINNSGILTGAGTINVSGTLVNPGWLYPSGGKTLDLVVGNLISTGHITDAGSESLGSAGRINLTVSPGLSSDFKNGTLTGGMFEVWRGGSIYFNIGQKITTNAGSIHLVNGGEMYSFDSVSQTYVPLAESLNRIAAGGTFWSTGNGLVNWTALAVDGELSLLSDRGTGQFSSDLTINPGGVVSGIGTLRGSIVNNGKIIAGDAVPDISFISSGSLIVTVPVTGSGTLEIKTAPKFQSSLGSVTLQLAASAITSQNVVFQDRLGTLQLDDPSSYSGQIVPTGAGDKILLPHILLDTVTGYGYSGNSSNGTLTIHTTNGDVNLKFAGSFVAENFAIGAAPQDLSSDPKTVQITNTGGYRPGAPGDDDITLPNDGTWVANGYGGDDTVRFGFRLVDAKVSYAGSTVIIDLPGRPLAPASDPLPGHFVLTGFEKFVFADGTIDNNDGSPMVDDLFYYAKYRDVWNAHVDPDQHYDQFGSHEARDPNAFFSTTFYLSLNQDVKAAGINPVTHFDQAGWKEGRLPSASFDLAKYLAANADIAAAQVDPLAHFLQYGAGEGRQPIAATSLLSSDGFDALYYLKNNPDVQAAEVDPHQHYLQFGWKEGRNPNALFDDGGYLANYTDVKNAGINPLLHYHQFGWTEGRDPSKAFDTTSYLAAYPDVQAIHIDPLLHFLQFGMAEGRSAFADGVWG